ncbi:hypothetical protein PIB30_038298 [Stylosanthes scabra]|uniref:Aminotransferase-like plant mobile domain-containing protein n=1 Tax=Stylosanthes scabra TaxID=79078 RepID=A0ABU6SEZ9_9FABA|nr:hypothetical protein [Stylosanthes scabra]
MAQRSIEKIAADDRRVMYWLDNISHVAHNVSTEPVRCIISVRRQIAIDLHLRKYQRWHGLWASRVAQLFDVAESDDSGPFAVFLQWWFLAARRYLVPVGPYHHLPADDIPDSQLHIQSDLSCQMCRITDDRGGG